MVKVYYRPYTDEAQKELDRLLEVKAFSFQKFKDRGFVYGEDLYPSMDAEEAIKKSFPEYAAEQESSAENN